MTQKEQDKLWTELSEEKQKEYKERYNFYVISVSTETHLSNYEWGIKEGEARILIDIFGEHNLQPALTYGDVARELFESGYYYYDYVYDEIVENSAASEMPMACNSRRQVEKICALNRLLNVAKFLNRNKNGSDWVPDWIGKDNKKWYLYVSHEFNQILCDYCNSHSHAPVYFRTKEIAEQAVQILGEDCIRTALTSEY